MGVEKTTTTKFNRFSSLLNPSTPLQRKKDLMLLLQELNNLAKSLHVNSKGAFYRLATPHNVFFFVVVVVVVVVEASYLI